MSDVRSLEEVIAVARGEWFEKATGMSLNQYQAAAVREWCLAPQQIATAVEAIFGCTNFGDFDEVAVAVLRAVMGDTP